MHKLTIINRVARTFTFLWLTALHLNGAYSQVYDIERQALLALYSATNGESWENNSGWKDAAVGTECTWYGVACAGESITQITLSQNNLSGSIPFELGNLVSLVRLDLGSNSLSGSIPTSLDAAGNLTFIRLSNNSLSGSIPSELGRLSNLTYLGLSNNLLSGRIPSELGNLNNLERLWLHANSLSGSIPSELGNLSNLAFLNLGSNSLTGDIPFQLGSLNSLERLYLYANSLSGSIPSELGDLSNLTYLILDGNSLSGSIPAELGNLVNLTVLDLSSNLLTGTVPEVLYSLPKLNSFKISNNAYVPIVELTYESLLEDSDGADGEEVTLSATAEDLDGTISETKWLFEGDVISTELSLTFRLPNGENEVLFIATDDSGRATSKTAIIKVKANYEPTTAKSALSLELNNIGLYEATSGAVATCVKIYEGGEPSAFNGVTQYDIVFNVIDQQTGNIQYTNARPFNEIEKLTSDGELPDCSGTYDIGSNLYSDTIETRLLTNLFGVALQIVKTFKVTFEIIDPANLIFQLQSYEELSAP